MGDDGDQKKKIAIMGVSSILLVAMVVAVAVGVNNNPKDSDGGGDKGTSTSNQISTTSKEVKALCAPSVYKETCETSLSKSVENATDPKKIVQVGFEIAVESLKDAMKNSTTIKEVAQDPKAKRAVEICEDLIETAIDDLRRSLDELDNFDPSKAYIHIDNLKTWLEATITYQEVCRDEFGNTTGTSGEKMREILKLSGELTSNGVDLDFPSWVTPTQRRLLVGTPDTLKPDIVVAQDGSGQFKTVAQAVQSIQKNHKVPLIMHIKAGVYNEQVTVPRWANGLMMIVILAPGFIAKDMGFENSAGAIGHQAVAYRSQSDNSVVFNCQFDGYQDTLYPQSNRQFFRDCVISGTIDFIFGVARTVLQNCTMIVRKPLDNQQCIVTAEGRQDPNGDSAIVIMNSHILGDPAYLPVKDKLKAYLGRPWKEYSRTVIMHTVIDGIIAPEGWLPWQGDLGLKTLWYAEFGNTGPGSVQTGRVNWPGIKHIGPAEAANFAPGKLYVEGDDWITATSVPYTSGMNK
ncbi:unnamed protein product [Linum tenue]|uniref:Pectinesterase n=1 Tax=Linum tenue TaxID=586396 RepID=A0AAV0P7Y5_9ROSI|nr:unnamed protein product [Linum tenue]